MPVYANGVGDPHMNKTTAQIGGALALSTVLSIGAVAADDDCKAVALGRR